MYVPRQGVPEKGEVLALHRPVEYDAVILYREPEGRRQVWVLLR